jgi:tetratricopeptide (TPR) repeat protein
MSAPAEYEQLLDRVLDALERDEVAAARRHLVKARAGADDEQVLGTIAALESACLAIEDREAGTQHLWELEERAGDDRRGFANAVGCTLSDVGERLGDDRFLELADEWFSRLTSRDPQAITFTNHGVVLERLERLEDATAAFERAVKLDPQFHDVRLRLARLAAQQGHFDLATREYRAYLEAYPDDAHEWISLAIAACDAGRVEDAEQAYWRAAGLEPGNVSLHFNWLISARRAGFQERAQYALDKLRALAPTDWRTRMAEVWALEDSGAAAAALALCERAFLDHADDDDSTPGLEYLAAQALRIARGAGLAEQARAFVDHVFATETFSVEVLHLVRALEGAETAELCDFSVEVEALYTDVAEPFGCYVWYQVLAPDAEAAAAAARAFEERCGAAETRAGEVEQLTKCEDAEHPGVRWRSGRAGYPAHEFHEG